MKKKARKGRNPFQESLDEKLSASLEEYLQDIRVELKLQSIGGEGGNSRFTIKQLKRIQTEWRDQGIIR